MLDINQDKVIHYELHLCCLGIPQQLLSFLALSGSS